MLEKKGKRKGAPTGRVCNVCGVSDLGFCLIALLMEDLFPTDNPKSYVAGEADRSNRCWTGRPAQPHCLMSD